MPKNPSSVDGFIPRRATGPADISRKIPTDSGNISSGAKSYRSQIGTASRPIENTAVTQQSALGQVKKSDIDESLAGIDNEDETPKKRFGFLRRRRKVAKPQSRRKKIIKRGLIALVVLLLVIGGFLAIRALLASGKIFQGNLLGLFTSQPLKMDANGRSNILIFGTSEDDPGHEGALLTDSIMLVSVDQNKNNAYLISIPRDLWVEYGAACNSGYAGRINEVYSCFSSDGQKEKTGARALTKKVGEVTGLDVQYYVHMNYGVLVDAVDAVGGVSVVIESDDPRGIFDDNFDWQCNRTCNYVKYKNGPTGLMDGKHALALARARGASGNTYGLAGANFDREKYQRKILVALKERAVSAGTLTNPAKVTGLIDAAGKNLRTNFETGEVRTLMRLGSDVPSEEIRSLELNTEDRTLVSGTLINGASVLVPAAGQGNFSDIQAFIRKKLSNNPVEREEAPVAVLNGTTQLGLAQTESDTLEQRGYTIVSLGNAPSTNYKDYTVYQLKKGFSGTNAALEKLYGVSVQTKVPKSIAIQGDPAFVVIVGEKTSTDSGQ